MPLAVSAITSETLENSSATDIRQLNQVSPSLLVSSTSSEAGAAVEAKAPIPFKAHGRKASSLFALGLKTICKALASPNRLTAREYAFLGLGLLFWAGFVILLGKDTSWDFRNYH